MEKSFSSLLSREILSGRGLTELSLGGGREGGRSHEIFLEVRLAFAKFFKF